MVEFTPVRPRNGGLVHAILLTDGHKTVCKRIAAGWIVSIEALSCPRCKELIRAPRKIL